MPARKRKRRRLPQPRQRRRVLTQNRLPPADTFNLEARSFSTWPSSLWHRHLRQSGSDLVGPTGVSRLVLDAQKHVPPRPCAGRVHKYSSSSRALGRGISHLLTRIRTFARFLIVYAIRNYSLLEQLDLGALSFPTQAAKIALWKLLDARFRSRN